VTGRLQRTPSAFPVRQQVGDALGVDHRARKRNVGADLGPLLEHRHGQFGVELPSDRIARRGPRPRAHDDDVIFHRFALDGFAHRGTP